MSDFDWSWAGKPRPSSSPRPCLRSDSPPSPPHLRADSMQTRTRTGESLHTIYTYQDRRIDDGGHRTATFLKSLRRTSGLRSESRKRRCSGPTTGQSRSSLFRLQRMLISETPPPAAPNTCAACMAKALSRRTLLAPCSSSPSYACPPEHSAHSFGGLLTPPEPYV